MSSQLSGQVAQLLANFDDPLDQGQRLARLDAQSLAASIRAAQADLEMAAAELRMGEAAVERAQAALVNARALRAVAAGEADSARAKHEKARLEVAHSEALIAKKMISTSEADQARTQSESTAALLRTARALLQVRDTPIQAAGPTASSNLAPLQVRRASPRRCVSPDCAR